MDKVVGRRRAPCQITVRSDRLALSRTASEDMPEYIDLYESGNILALKGDGEGQIRLSVGSHKFRQNIRSQEARDYICKKFECKPGDVLSAWYRGDVLMFAKQVTPQEAKLGLDESFKKVNFSTKAPETFSVRVRGQVVTLSASAAKVLGDSVSAYEYEKTMLLLPNEEGALHLTKEKGSNIKSIHSKELADYIRNKFGIDDYSLYAWEKDGGIYFSDKRTTKRAPQNVFEKLRFQMSEENVTVNLLQQSRLMVSYLGAVVLQRHLSLYKYGSIIALVSDPDGEFKAIQCSGRSGCDITGRDLVLYIKQELALEDETIMSATVRGNGVYFSNQPITYLPPLRRFEKVEFGRVCQFNVISAKIQENGYGRLYISKSSREIIKEGASLWRNGDVLALVNDENGDFKVSASGYVGSRVLGDYMKSELGITENRRFYIRNGKAVVFFSEKRIDEDMPLKLEDFERVNFELLKQDKAPKGARKAHPVGEAWEKQRQVRDKRRQPITK